MTVKTYNLLKWVLFPLRLIWEFPQNFVGFLVFLFSLMRGKCTRTITEDGIVVYYVDNNNPCYGVSLGFWIFLRDYYKTDNVSSHHEWGHQKQSMLLGLLYLLIIGLPSGGSNFFHTYTSEQQYYNYPWEKWADKWGGVKHIYQTDTNFKNYYKREL